MMFLFNEGEKKKAIIGLGFSDQEIETLTRSFFMLLLSSLVMLIFLQEVILDPIQHGNLI